MPFNGSGVFVRLYDWENDAQAGINIRADRMDNETDGIAVGLSTCLTKDGQTTPTANLPMAAFRHTSVGDATARNQYTSYGQMQDGKSNWVVATGTVDAIAAAYAISIPSPTDGILAFVRLTGANATTTPTFSPNGATARVITKEGGQPLAIGEFSNGYEAVLRYNLANTRWELINPKASSTGLSRFNETTIASATTTNLGTAGSQQVSITGTTTITSFGSGAVTTNPLYSIRFTGILTLTHNVTSLILPTGANITTADGDTAWALYLGAGNWKVLSYYRINGMPLTSSTDGTFAGNSNLLLPTQAAVKTYVDGKVAALTILGTPQVSTSGTSIDFLALPTGVKRITVSFADVSTNGTDNIIFQLGDSGGIEATGYSSVSSTIIGSVSGSTYANGFGIRSGAAANVLQGAVILTLMDATTNTWSAMGTFGNSNGTETFTVGGSKSLSAVLDRIRVTTTGGTNTFDGGKMNILYEV